MERLVVIPFLERALQWRVATARGIIVPNNQIEGLEVSVVSADMRPSAVLDAFPAFGSWSILPDVTDGKAGGLRMRSLEKCET